MTVDPGELPLKGLALPGGSSLLRGLAKLGVTTVADLLTYLPRRYEDRREITPIAELVGGTSATISARVTDLRVEKTWRRGVQRTIATLVDDSGAVDAVWYGRRFIERRLTVGTTIVATGRVKAMGWTRQLEAPEFSPVGGGDQVSAGRIVPIYRLTRGVTALSLRRAVRALLDQFGAELVDPMPQSVQARNDLMPLAQAIEALHWPEEFDLRDAALRRLAFDELLAVQIALVHRSRRRAGDGAFRISPTSKDLIAIESAILGGLGGAKVTTKTPWTGDQRRAIDEILADLATGAPMLRLLQGDVGTGKTAVAFVAAAATARAGHQSALLAPTELLARQHAATAKRLLAPLGIEVALVLGGAPVAERRAARTAAADGKAALVIGTHALFAEGTQFASLGLVIVDEQHRFGVEERAKLLSKASREPHLLLMTATPIPRTIAQLLYADVASSELRELPSGRQPIRTAIRTSADLERVWAFVDEEAAAGRQTFVVVPRITDAEGDGEPEQGTAFDEELDAAGATGVEAQAQLLRERLPHRRIGVVHGQQRATERTEAMQAFVAGETDVLVGTTVIEVGVDVRAASVMVILEAERFGLATLHQLRGRVGRGGDKGWCILVSDSDDEVAAARLQAIESTRDGFLLAEQDIALRGEGSVLGTSQSGLPPLRIATLARADDRALALVARSEAEQLLNRRGDATGEASLLVQSYARGWPIGRATGAALTESAPV
ncbi:MAG: ATP-dependent DNA helicase RecG [Candidatus Aquidulcis sp.]|nr:MAG: ATP-dependent DNA helicase RecG [Candidatus Aquidulcis sp.]